MLKRRAWVLAILGALVPGTAQLVAGSRRLARLALIASLIFWLSLTAAVVAALTKPALLVEVAANPVLLGAAAVFIAGFGLIYLVTSFSTLRLMGVGGLPLGARVAPVLFVLIASAVVSALAFQTVAVAAAQAGLVQSVFASAKRTEPVAGRYNILLLGADSGKNRIGIRPDSISVVSIDAETGQAVNIGIPRNLQKVGFREDSPLRVIYPNGFDCGNECLINALHTVVEENYAYLYPNAEAIGSTAGIEATRDAVEYVTGLTIQSFVLIDMAGFKDLIDAVGGVSVMVETRLPIGGTFTASGELLNPRGWIEPGYQKLDGQRALWFARARYGSSDYERMQRQRTLEEALLDQLNPVSLASSFVDLAAVGERLLITDMPREMLPRYSELAIKTRALGIDSLQLTPPLIDVMNPDFPTIWQIVAGSTQTTATPG